MEKIKNKKLAGGAIVIGSLVPFGKETLAWGWSKLLDALSTGSANVTLMAIPWQNLIASVMGIVGLVLLFWPSKKAKKLSRTAQFYALYEKADYFVSRVRHDRRLDWYERERRENLGDLARDGLSLLLSFQDAGLPIPVFETRSAEKMCIGMEVYFSLLKPFMRDGQIKQVDATVVGVVEHAENTCDAFDPETWFIDHT
jgi:hypothetical protein